MEMPLKKLAQQLGERLGARGMLVATAESCTGGWVAKVITDIAGSSLWFDRGFVTYSNQAKQEMLGVSGEILATEGAVSEATVVEMARGALRNSQASVAVSLSGIAGPGGGSPEKPVGTVWIAVASAGQMAAKRYQFDGDRDAVRAATLHSALEMLLDLVRRKFIVNQDE